MASLADIRARLAQQENKSNGNNNNSGDNPLYAHWNMPDGSTAVVRFLEDGNPDNPFFWVERNVFKFPFNGIKASQEHNVEASSKEVIVQVPCLEMFGEKDPVLDEVRTWFKDPSLEDMGRKYWKKRSYLFQGFVREDPMEGSKDYTVPENPIRRFIITPQIFNLIKTSLMDPDIENLPTDHELGLDFRIKKDDNAGHANYTGSSWARRESALTAEELQAIETHGLNDLATLLPKRPNEQALSIIHEMFEASVDGEPYDVDRWGRFYTPYGVSLVRDDENTSTDKPAKSAPKPAPKPAKPASKEVQETTLAEDVKVAEKAVSESNDSEEESGNSNDKAQDILAIIRNRQK